MTRSAPYDRDRATRWLSEDPGRLPQFIRWGLAKDEFRRELVHVIAGDDALAKYVIVCSLDESKQQARLEAEARQWVRLLQDGDTVALATMVDKASAEGRFEAVQEYLVANGFDDKWFNAELEKVRRSE